MKLIKNAAVVDVEQGEILKSTDILIENGKILAVGAQLEAEAAEVIDASGLYALPGFIDAHSHIGGFEIVTGNQEVNEMSRNITAEMKILDGLDLKSPMFQSALSCGITVNAIAPGSGNVIGGIVSAVKSWGQDERAQILKKEAALKAAMGNNPKGVYGKRNQMPMTRMGVAALLRQYFRDVQEYMKNQQEAASDPAKQPAFDLAKENGAKVLRGEIPLKVHCTQFDMITMIDLAKEFHFKITLDHVWGASRYLDALTQAKCPVLFGPIAVAKGYGESVLIDIESVAELDKRGVECSIITDGPVYHPWAILSQAAEVYRCGVPLMNILKMLTIYPAKAIGCAERVGSLQPGKDADIVLFDGMPVESPRAYVVKAFVNGELAYENENI